MKILVTECVHFIAQNLKDVVRLPIDMSCLNSALINKVALEVPIDELDDLQDRKDKLSSRLFQKKLNSLLKEHSVDNEGTRTPLLLC